MANNLTGVYDAVLLVRVLKIEGLLGTLHQNGSDEDASPTFLHSVTVRVGDRIVRPDLTANLGQYAEWFKASRPFTDTGRPEFSQYAPPGASRVLAEAFDDLQALRQDILVPPAATVRGTARLQLSTLSLSLPPGTTSEVTIAVNIRAHYTPDPGTIALPEPVHGEVRITYSAAVKTLLPPILEFGGIGNVIKSILEIQVPQDDNKIQFHPAAGIVLSPFEFSQLLAEIRKVVREGFEPINVALPADFPFRQFRELSGGQVLTLPMQLTQSAPPVGGLGTVTNNFLNDDFAIAISKEFVQTKLQPTLDEFSHFRRDFPVRVPIPFDGSFTLTTYHVSVTGVGLEWKDGSIDLIIRARAVASILPDYDVTIRQPLTLNLIPVFQWVFLRASNEDLTIDLDGLGSRFLGFVRDRIRDAIIPERDAALPDAELQINQELSSARTRFNDGLERFDSATSARYVGLQVTPDGLILQGDIVTTPARRGPMVAFEETRDHSAFTALQSWIPSGRINRFEWSWLRQVGPFPTPWSLETVVGTEDHRFVFPKPPEVTDAGGICLRIHGIQVDRNGFALPIAGGEYCEVHTPEVNWQMPAWLETLTIPIWLPDAPEDGILEDAIAGHVNVLAHSRPTRELGTNSLVHFVDPRAQQPLKVLAKALAKAPQSGASLVVIVVLPAGSFGGRRGEVEAQLGSLGKNFRGRLLLTEDYTGGWRRTFDVENAPSTYLINARGAFVWQQEGILDVKALAAAVDEHCTSGQVPLNRRLGLIAPIGGHAPRALFRDDQDQQLALHKLRGHPVLLSFWQSWSAPSIKELRRLQALHGQGGGDAPVIVAINGDKDCTVFAEIRRKHKLGFSLVHDPNGFIARTYGVQCWPTTVSIDPDGKVDGVRFGIARAHPVDEVATAAS